MNLRLSSGLALVAAASVAALVFVVACGDDLVANPLQPDGGSSSGGDSGVITFDGSTGNGMKYDLEQVFTQVAFANPVEMVQGPQSRHYVLEQGGKLWEFTDQSLKSLALDLTGPTFTSGGESGLLGLAFHPQFASNGFIYVYYTAVQPDADAGVFTSVLARFHSTDGGLTFDRASEKRLLTLDQPYTNHNGGKLLFGADRYLYLSLGDGGSAGDPENRAQNTNVLFGKILRLDVDSADPYGIPADNPFAAGDAGRGEIYAYGLRNTWRFSFDSMSNTLWAGDVGQDMYEEVDKIVKGGNYGWRQREGKHCYNPMSGCVSTDLIDPVVEYGHDIGNSVTGGYVYHSTRLPDLNGHYIFGDYAVGKIFSLDEAAGALTWLNPGGKQVAISAFSQADDGDVYVVDYSRGGIYRLIRGTTD